MDCSETTNVCWMGLSVLKVGKYYRQIYASEMRQTSSKAYPENALHEPP